MDSPVNQVDSGSAVIAVRYGQRREAIRGDLKPTSAAVEDLMNNKAWEDGGWKQPDILPENGAGRVELYEPVASAGLTTQFSTLLKRRGQRPVIALRSPAESQDAGLVSGTPRRPAAQTEMPPADGGFRSIAENIPEGILIAPGFNGPHLYANRFATELTGYSIAELLQLGPAHLVPLGDYPRIRQRLEQPLIGEDLPESCQATLLRKDGQATPVDVTGTPVVWQGRPAILILVKDVSRYISREEELKQRVLELQAKWQANSEALERHMDELATQKNDLDRTHREVVRTNTALSVLARNIDRRRQELEEKIALDVSVKILPVVNELRRDKLPARILAKLDVVAALLAALTPEGSKAHEVIAALSATELRVALMIKKGFSSDRIAGLLNSSPHTIKTHRRNIRKKLGVQNSKVNLSSYLKLKVPKDTSSLFLKAGYPFQDREVRKAAASTI